MSARYSKNVFFLIDKIKKIRNVFSRPPPLVRENNFVTPFVPEFFFHDPLIFLKPPPDP